jgi:hypothetical protein
MLTCWCGRGRRDPVPSSGAARAAEPRLAYASKAYGLDARVQQNYVIVAGRGGNLTIPSDCYLEIHGQLATGAFWPRGAHPTFGAFVAPPN